MPQIISRKISRLSYDIHRKIKVANQHHRNGDR